MNAERNKSDDRLERMLRQWGVDQAARQAPAPPALAPARRQSVVVVIGRWAPLAAAAVLVIAAATLYRASMGAARHGAENAVSVAAPSEMPTSPDAGYVALMDAEAQIAAMTEQLAELELVRAAAEAERSRLADDAQLLQRRLADAEIAMTNLRDQYELERTERIRQAALAERAAALAERAASVQMQTEAERAEALRTARQAPTAGTVDLYLTIAAPGQTGVSAVRAAALNRRLTDRCLALRQRAEDEAATRLLDRLEVILTRLEMLDVTDEKAVAAFVALTRTGQTRELLTQAAGRGGDDERQRFLLEVQLIFQGVDRVA